MDEIYYFFAGIFVAIFIMIWTTRNCYWVDKRHPNIDKIRELYTKEERWMKETTKLLIERIEELEKENNLLKKLLKGEE